MNSKNQFRNRLILIFPYLLFFLFAFIYLNVYASYIFFYQEKSSLFLVSWSYLSEHLSQPGGLLNYLGELQTAFYFYPFVGALIISLEILLVIYFIQQIGKEISGNIPFLIPFIIGGLLFYLQTNYQYYGFNNLGILIQLLLFYLYVKIKSEKLKWIPVILFPVLYFIMGSFSLIFLVLFTGYIFLKPTKYSVLKITLLLVLSAVFFFFGKEFLFFQTTRELLIYPFTEQQIGLQMPLFLIVVILVSVLPFMFYWSPKRIYSTSIRKVTLLKFTPFLVIIVLVFISVPRIDKKNSHYFHVEKLFYEQKYKEIIAFNEKFPSTNKLTIFLNNIALFETGKLNDELFNFPQSADGGTLYLKWEIVTEILKRGGYFYYNLGMVNEANRWAYEYMVMRGNSPEVIRMLIKTELINGNFKVAEKYISILKRSVFYRKEARNFEKYLFNEDAILANPEFARIKKLKPKTDFFVISDNPIVNIDLILKADSTNRAAMEYKLATLLLEKDMKGIVAELPQLEKMGYTQMPKNVEEAVVSYKLLKVGEMPHLDKLKINPKTIERFQQYYKIFLNNQSNKQQAQRALFPGFGNTYWYYVFFN